MQNLILKRITINLLGEQIGSKIQYLKITSLYVYFVEFSKNIDIKIFMGSHGSFVNRKRKWRGFYIYIHTYRNRGGVQRVHFRNSKYKIKNTATVAKATIVYLFH